MVKNLPVMQETRIRSLGREDSLEKEMATHSSILVWRIPWTEKPGITELDTAEQLTHASLNWVNLIYQHQRALTVVPGADPSFMMT